MYKINLRVILVYPENSDFDILDVKQEKEQNESKPEPVKSTETTILEEILTHLQTNTNVQVFNKAHDNIASQDGVKGEKRLKTLDKAFNVIVDQLIPDTFAVGFYFMELNTDENFYIDRERLAKLKNMSKYQVQEAYNKHEVNDGDIYWHEMGLTDEKAAEINK